MATNNDWKWRTIESHTRSSFYLLTVIKILSSPKGDFAEEQFISGDEEAVKGLYYLWCSISGVNGMTGCRWLWPVTV